MYIHISHNIELSANFTHEVADITRVNMKQDQVTEFQVKMVPVVESEDKQSTDLDITLTSVYYM